MASMSRVTYKLKEGNGRKFNVVGTGIAIADARAEAAAKLALTVGAGVGASESTSIATADGGGAGAYSDIEVILNKGMQTVSVHIENVANSFAELIDTVPTGRVDPTALAGFVAAYRDGAGLGGYSLKDAYYVR
jgi:uncharacterized spore protein YtfJ